VTQNSIKKLAKTGPSRTKVKIKRLFFEFNGSIMSLQLWISPILASEMGIYAQSLGNWVFFEVIFFEQQRFVDIMNTEW